MPPVLRQDLLSTVAPNAVLRGPPISAWLRGGASFPRSGRFKVFITADIDPANERDDEGAAAIWFAQQDVHDIQGLVADAPDGLVSGWAAMLDAYEADYGNVSTYGGAGEFKTRTEFDAMTVQGPNIDAPAAGYWTSGDLQFTEAEAAADAILAAAANGDPAGTFETNPYGKLIVVSQGGVSSMAQALYRAITLGEMPDFTRRVVWFVQSKHNSFNTANAWRFIMANYWQAAATPGDFGDLEIFNPCWLAHALNNEGATAEQVWNYAINSGSMGAALDAERASSNYPADYYRAGDAWFAWFLKEVRRLENYRPDAPGLRCGVLRTISDGTRYPWVTGAWGPSDANGGWPTTGTVDSPYAPSHWIPEDPVDSKADALLAVGDLSDWHDLVYDSLSRYRAPSPTTPITAALTNEWLFADGSGTSAANEIAGKQSLTLSGPSWVSGGLNFAGTDIADGVEDADLNGRDGHTWSFIFKLDSVSGTQQIFGRDYSFDNTTRQFQIRVVEGIVNGLWRYGDSTTNSQVNSTTTLVAGAWYVVTLHLNLDRDLELYINGTLEAAATLPSPPNSGAGYNFTAGNRDGNANPLNGTLGYMAHMGDLPHSMVGDVYAYVTGRFESTHGITL